MSVSIPADLFVALALCCQGAARANPSAEGSAARLSFMKHSVENYRFSNDSRESPAQLQVEPAFRLGKQGADALEEGAIFFWNDDTGRPEAAIQVFFIRESSGRPGFWVHEFTSLSPKPLTLKRRGQPYWTPETPGVKFKPLPGAPMPAESAAQRTRQLRALAQGFRASDNFHEKGWSELRLLPTPIARYGKTGSRLPDGALFAFVLGTDPEVFLFLEVRPGKDGLEWQYALAPMTVFAVKASHQGKPVWELPDRSPANSPTRPFFDISYEP
jgi:hypothetical protein